MWPFTSSESSSHAPHTLRRLDSVAHATPFPTIDECLILRPLPEQHAVLGLTHCGGGHQGGVVAGGELGEGMRLVGGGFPELHLAPQVAVQVLAMPAVAKT